MVIAVILIGAFFIHYALDAAYRRFWSRGLDARVEFQKEPVTEGKEAVLTETITNEKWLFLPLLQVGFHIHRNLWFQDGENTSVSDQCYKRGYIFRGKLSEDYPNNPLSLYQKRVL